jgi:hypothetical protein
VGLEAPFKYARYAEAMEIGWFLSNRINNSLAIWLTGFPHARFEPGRLEEVILPLPGFTAIFFSEYNRINII